MAPLPIKFTEVLQLSSVGVDAAAIGFNSCVSCPDPILTFIGLLYIPGPLL